MSFMEKSLLVNDDFNSEIDYLDVNDLVNWSMLRSQEKGLGKLAKQVYHGGSKHDKFRV